MYVVEESTDRSPMVMTTVRAIYCAFYVALIVVYCLLGYALYVESTSVEQKRSLFMYTGLAIIVLMVLIVMYEGAKKYKRQKVKRA